MATSETSSVQRARTKTPDFYELFRSSHGPRHSGRTPAANESSPSLVSSPSPAEKASATKPRRSMLPFLGRRKPAEQSAGTSTQPPPSRKSHGGIPANPINTVRRSFGNGHTVLMITPSPVTVSVPPLPVPPPAPPFPSKLPSMDAPSPSLGSKLAAHFTPLRSPAKTAKPRNSLVRKSAPASSLVPTPAKLSPPVPDIRAPSIESQNSITSRSTTPRPLRIVHPSDCGEGDEEDFSDLFTLPNQIHGAEHSQKNVSTLSVNTVHCELKSGEVSPVDPITPPGPCLQFPIPPSTIGRPQIGLSENGPLRSSMDLISLSSRHSRSPSKAASPKTPCTPQFRVDSGSDRAALSDSPSPQDERHRTRHRAKSVTGSETDTSRNYDSSHSSTSAKIHLFPKPPNLKSSASCMAKASSGPPPSVPLPTPPLSPLASSSGGLGLRSVPNTPPSTRLPISPRPRAITLSVTSNLKAPGQSIPCSTQSQTRKDNAILMSDATAEELRDALVLQRRKNSQLQDYIATITKRYEDDRLVMTRTIEKLERNVRKKTREIEGLRWLVIHNGAVSDIDAAANLARSSLSTQEDGEVSESRQGTSSLNLAGLGALLQGCPTNDGSSDEPLSSQSTPAQKGLVLTTRASSSTLEVPSDTASSATPSPITSSPPSSLPERFAGISRAERQKSKEERRATKALRRISASFVSGAIPTTPTTLPPSTDNLLDPSFDPKQSMDEVLERLRPFGNC